MFSMTLGELFVLHKINLCNKNGEKVSIYNPPKVAGIDVDLTISQLFAKGYLVNVNSFAVFTEKGKKVLEEAFVATTLMLLYNQEPKAQTFCDIVKVQELLVHAQASRDGYAD